MSIPQPKVPLKDHCSVIYDGTLYTYQPDAFQSLDLKQGGQWSQLDGGVSANGSACVQGSVDGDPAFIVIGGSTSTQGYHGIQHYSFKSKSWNSDKPADGVCTNRQAHGATYLQQSLSLLTYGGSQDKNPNPSSQTFVISTISPYATEAFSSQAPPVIQPLLIPFNASHALMLGGNPTNTQLWLFSPWNGWGQLGASLPNAIQDSTKVQANVVTGSDGSKTLQIFNLSQSPNTITQVVLHNSTSHQHRRSGIWPHARHLKRDQSATDRPTYNATGAPQDARSGFSLATDPSSGLVVASGGDSQTPLVIFNQTSNQWVDAGTFFGAAPSASTTTSPTPTFSPTAAPSAVAKATTGARNRSLTILGGVLGGVVGAAVLFILILLALRQCRKRRERQVAIKQREYSLRLKEGLGYADGHADYLRPDGSYDVAAYTHDGRPIRSGAASAQSQRALLHHQKNPSAGSAYSYWSRGDKSPNKQAPQISAPILGPPLSRTLVSPDPRAADAGWSRYFQSTSQENLAQTAPAGTNPTTRDTFASNSDYTASRVASSHNPHQSAEVAPLNFRPSQYTLPANARSVSPTNYPPQPGTTYPPPGYGVALTHGAPRTEPPRPRSPSIVSDIEEETEEGTDYRHSEGQESWTPVDSQGEWNSDHRTSSNRISSNTNSASYPHPGERVPIPNFPMPSSRNSLAGGSPSVSTPNVPDLPTQRSDLPSYNQGPTSPRGMRNVVTRDLIRSNSGREPTAAPGTGRVNASTVKMVASPTMDSPSRYFAQSAVHDSDDDEGGMVHNFPRQPVGKRTRERGTEDMSWLNLGTSHDPHQGQHYFPG